MDVHAKSLIIVFHADTAIATEGTHYPYVLGVSHFTLALHEDIAGNVSLTWPY